MIISKQGYPGLSLSKACNIILGTEFKTNAEALKYCRHQSNILKSKWFLGNSLSIYSDTEYICETILSYFLVTREAAKSIGIWTEIYKTHNKTFFDYYNGCGLMTVYLSAIGYQTYCFNDNKIQVDVCNLLHDSFKLKRPIFVDEFARYDFVGHFEVLEHFKDPLPIVNTIVNCLKPNGYLFESTGFADSTLPGHYETYHPGVSGRQMSKLVTDVYRQAGLKKIYTGFSTKPRVWSANTDILPIKAKTYISL